MPQWLKDLLKNKKVMAMVAAAALAGLAMLTGVPKEALKEAVCAVEPVVAAPAVAPVAGPPAPAEVKAEVKK